jgi:hypothetical protein
MPQIESRLIPLGIKGAYTSPAIPSGFNIKTASAAELTQYGFPQVTAVSVTQASSPLHSLLERTWLPDHRIIPQFAVKTGRDHRRLPGTGAATNAPAISPSSNWSGGVVNSPTGAPLPRLGSPLDGYATPFNQQQHINYIGVNNHIYELFYTSTWKFNDLTALTGAPNAAPASALDGYVTLFNQQQHINFISADGLIHELVYDGSWKHNPLTGSGPGTASSAPPAAPGSSLDGYSTEFNRQQHINYISADGNIHELVYDGSWKHNPLTGAAPGTASGAPPAAPGSALDGYSTDFNQQQHVNYIGVDGHVHELVYDGSWKHHDLSKEAGTGIPAAGSPLNGYTTAFNQQQHVNFIGADGLIHEFLYAGSWQHKFLTGTDPNAAPNAPAARAGSRLHGYVTTFNQQQHINYIGVDGHLHELFYAGRWQHSNLTQTTRVTGAGLPSTATPINGYVTDFNQQQHVNYIGLDGKVYELYYTGQWQLNVPSTVAVVPWTDVFGIWHVPVASQPDLPQGPEGGWNSSLWVGIDGSNNTQDVLQAGTGQDLTSDGSPFYYAWFEWFAPRQDGSPDYVDEIQVTNFPVSPGDQIYCNVQYIDGNTRGRIMLLNMTTNFYFSVDLDPPPGAAFSGNCVEWIMEVTTISQKLSSLPQFTPIEFRPAFGSNLAGQTADPFNGVADVIKLGNFVLTAVTITSGVVDIRYLPWHDSDLVQVTGSPNASSLTALDGYVTSFNQQQHVNFIDVLGHVHELVYDGSWQHHDLSNEAGNGFPAAGAAVHGYSTEFNKQQHVNFIADDGLVHELLYDGSWQHKFLTGSDPGAAPGAPAASLTSSLSGYSTPFNLQQHINFIGVDGHVHELVYDGSWKHHDLTGETGNWLPAAGSSLAGYTTEFNQQQHVLFIGGDNLVHELLYDGSWQHKFLTGSDPNAAQGAPPPLPGSRLCAYVTTFNQQQHVNYMGTDGHIHELFYAGSWQHNPLTKTAGVSGPSLPGNGTPINGYATDFNQQQHVNYIGRDGHVHELFYTGQWQHNDLSNASGIISTPVLGSLAGFQTAFNRQEHVFYIGNDHHVHELYF